MPLRLYKALACWLDVDILVCYLLDRETEVLASKLDSKFLTWARSDHMISWRGDGWRRINWIYKTESIL